MQSLWLVDSIDQTKSMVKLRKRDSNSVKTVFFSKLKEVEIKGNTLLVSCEDCVWMLDIETGVRRRIDPAVLMKAEVQADVLAHQNIPHFLKKPA